MQGYAKHITRLTLSIFSFLLDEYISKTKTKKRKKKKHPRKSIIFEKQEQALLAYCHFHPLIFDL